MSASPLRSWQHSAPSSPLLEAAHAILDEPERLLGEGASVDATSTVSTAQAPAPDNSAPVDVPAFERRVVLFDAEELLVDALALDVEPVASSSTVGGGGFHGLDAYNTGGIEVLPHPDINLEHLAALEPDVIVIIEPIAEGIGEDLLGAIGELWIVPHEWTPVEQVRLLGDAFDRVGYRGIEGRIRLPDDVVAFFTADR